MRVQIRYKYKEYPQAPSLTKKSQTIGKLTTPWIALIVAAIICGAPANMLMNVRDENQLYTHAELYVICRVDVPRCLFPDG